MPVATLSQILTPALAQMLDRLEIKRLVSPRIADELIDRWAAQGARVSEVGRSSDGRPIRAAVCGPLEPRRTLLCWGYPHPDEPLGASAIAWLFEEALAGRLPDLAHWRLVVIPCADPDQARRQLWLEGRASALEFAAGVWRPTHLSLEVDYGFPIDWGPFLHDTEWRGRCRLRRECEGRCGERCMYEDLPPGPLPESLALAEAIQRFEPDVIAALHNTHTGGDYTFLMLRERREVLRDLLEIPGAAGRGRHLGEAIDHGARWLRSEPDLLRERMLDYQVRRLERRPDYDPDALYAGNASAANFIESLPKEAQFTCPESTVFFHRDFADPSPWGRTELVREEVRRGRRGRFYRYRWMRDGAEWVLAEREHLPDRKRGRGPRELEVAVTRSMLAVRAARRRRRVLEAADRIWERVLPYATAPHIYREERARYRRLGPGISERSLLIYRSRADYHRPATVAQRASFAWEWPMHTATILGNFANFLAVQDESVPEIAAAKRELNELIAGEVRRLPPSMREQADWNSAARSILARVLRLMLARP